VQLVRDAVQFWNGVFTELGTTFRLGALSFVVGALPLDQLKALSDKVLSQTVPSFRMFPKSRDIISIVDGDFVFTARRARPKGPGGIKVRLSDEHRLHDRVSTRKAGPTWASLRDPTTLMCGRPASCRPNLFASPTERYFPLTPAEKAMLQNMYSADWQPRR
jgi:hypothetical protein